MDWRSAIGAAGSSPVPHPAADLATVLNEAQEHLRSLDREYERLVTAAVGANSDDEHDVEGASLAWERQQLQALRRAAAARVAAARAAVDRLAVGDYGRCTVCRQQIGAERLAARPDADRCVECAR